MPQSSARRPARAPILKDIDRTPGRRVDVNDTSRAIGTQIAATQKGFLPYDQVTRNPQQLAADYERLRLSHELSREIALERDLPTLLNKILHQRSSSSCAPTAASSS